MKNASEWLESYPGCDCESILWCEHDVMNAYKAGFEEGQRYAATYFNSDFADAVDPELLRRNLETLCEELKGRVRCGPSDNAPRKTLPPD